MGYSMKTPRFRYAQWQDRKTGKVLARELYDHQKDPHENINAVELPEYKKEVPRLAQILKNGWRSALPK
jgi:iduronate 2-sulfatase